MTDPARSPAPSLPGSTHLGAVYLRVSDLEASARFYEGTLGLQRLSSPPGALLLGAGTRPLVGLLAAPGAAPAPRAPGLYHLALLLPDRASLGAFLQHLVTTRARLQGASDHGVSEAIYLADPDGNGIEVYRDRPRSEWPLTAAGVEMITAPMDAQGVLAAGAAVSGPFSAPEGTTLGHVHLRVSSIERGRLRYVDTIGFDVTQASYPGALFTSAGGYHHHVGMNTWASEGKPAPAHGSLGLAWFEIAVPDPGGRALLEERLASSSLVREHESPAFPTRVYYDEDGIGVAVTG